MTLRWPPSTGPAAPNPGIVSRLLGGRQWGGIGEPGRTQFRFRGSGHRPGVAERWPRLPVRLKYEHS